MKPAITEAALDRVLERLLLASRDVAALFMQAAMPLGPPIAFDRIGIERQRQHIGASGTADLIVNYFAGPIRVAMLLVENKIDAGFTPDQPKRYEVCRDAHRFARTASVVATLLVAPQVYLAGSKLASGFDGVLAYERLLPAMTAADRVLMASAIDRAESPYEPIPVLAVMDFFAGYAKLVQEVAPDLVLKRNPNSGNARPEASRTIYFDAKRSGFSSFPFLLKEDRPASLRLSHQCWDSGAPNPSVKLMLDGWARHLRSASPMLLPALRGSGIYVRAAGLSLAFVLDTPRLDNMRPVLGQEAKIMDALTKIQRLRAAWNALGDSLRLCAQGVGTPPSFVEGRTHA